MKRCENTLNHTQKHSGWIAYLKLIIQLYGQIPQFWNMVGTMKEGKRVTRFMIIMLVFKMILKTPWWLIIKPFGCLFHSKTRYVGTHNEVSDQVFNYKYKKIGVVFFLRFIPVWIIAGRRMNKIDKERLFKDKVVA